MTDRPETVEQFHAKFLTESIDKTVDGLRRLADRVEAEATRVPKVGSGPGRGTYAAIAADVIHDITWGVANLQLERLCTEAAAADTARAKGE